ncbi:hypothetical protein [Pseudonocardia sp. NPDC046786]|uniref:hypothetical protein n=1 Tax=Pseudonocardia sp. NPDC046786 TaxID=3155471 RepID=UPI0033ED32F2
MLSEPVLQARIVGRGRSTRAGVPLGYGAAGSSRARADPAVAPSAPGSIPVRPSATMPSWADRVLVDATGRFTGTAPLALGDISGRTSSEIVADLAPGPRVVRAFTSAPLAWLADPPAGKPAPCCSSPATTPGRRPW